MIQEVSQFTDGSFLIRANGTILSLKNDEEAKEIVRSLIEALPDGFISELMSE